MGSGVGGLMGRTTLPPLMFIREPVRPISDPVGPDEAHLPLINKLLIKKGTNFGNVHRILYLSVFPPGIIPTSQILSII